MSDEVLNIEPHITLNTISIWAPRYSTGHALIGKHHVKEHNRIIFTKAKSLEGKEFYISDNKIKKYPTQDNNGKRMYVVPMADLKLMKQQRRVW